MDYIIDAAAANLDALYLLAAVVFLAGMFHNLFKFTDDQDGEE